LLWLRDVESTYTPRSVLVDNSELVDTDFEFDREIFTSRAYREAMKSHMKRAIASGSTDQQDNGQFLASDMVVRDHAMAHRIIENHDVDSQTREEQFRELSPAGHTFEDDVWDPGDIRPQAPMTEFGSYQNQGTPRHQDMISIPKPLSKPEEDPWMLPELTARTVENTQSRLRRKLRRGLITIPHALTRMKHISSLQRNLKSVPNTPDGIMATLEEHRQKDKKAKILLLGTSESGKSTLLKSLKLLHEGPYTTSERIFFTEIIFDIVIQSMRVILEAMEGLEIPLETSQNGAHVVTIFMQPRYPEQYTLSPDVTEAIKILWQDTGVVTCFQRSREYQLPDCAE